MGENICGWKLFLKALCRFIRVGRKCRYIDECRHPRVRARRSDDRAAVRVPNQDYGTRYWQELWIGTKAGWALVAGKRIGGTGYPIGPCVAHDARRARGETYDGRYLVVAGALGPNVSATRA